METTIVFGVTIEIHSTIRSLQTTSKPNHCPTGGLGVQGFVFGGLGFTGFRVLELEFPGLRPGA